MRWSEIDRAAVAFGVVLLGHTLQANDGFYSHTALFLLTASLVVLVAGASGAMARVSGRQGDQRLVAWVVYSGVLSNLFALAVSSPAMYLADPAPTAHPGFLAGIAAAAVLCTLMVARPASARTIWFPCLLLVFFGLARWVVRASPQPEVDVITVHRAAIAALLRGDSPYSIVWPNIYGGDDLYPPGFARDGYVYFGFPYPPFSLLLSTAARLVARDVRYAQVVLLAFGCALAGLARERTADSRLSRSIAPLAAALVLFTPRIFFVIEQGWTEPLAVGWLGIALFLASCASPVEAIAMGLLLAVKQHLVLLVPLLAWYRRGRADAMPYLLAVVGVAAVVTLPFVLWDAAGFWRSLVEVQLAEGFRNDSLGYLSWVAERGWRLPPAAVSVLPAIGAVAGIAFAWRHLPRNPAGLSLALGLTLLFVFIVAKKAFCNYYFLALAACAFAVAFWNAEDSADAAERPAPGADRLYH